MYKCTCMRPDKHTPVHACTRVRTYMCACTSTCTGTHAWTVHMHTLVHAHAYAHTEEGTGVTCLFIYLYTHVHTQTHACTRTHIPSCSEIRAPGSHSEPLHARSPSGGFGLGGQRGEGQTPFPGASGCRAPVTWRVLSCARPGHCWAGRAGKDPEPRRAVRAVCPGSRPPAWPGRWRVPAGVSVSSSRPRGS